MEREHPQGYTGTLAALRDSKGEETDGGRGNRIGTLRGDAGVDRYLGSRLRATINKAQVQAVEVGGIGRLSRWTGDPIPENKEENRFHKERFSSVPGWRYGGGYVNTRRAYSSVQLNLNIYLFVLLYYDWWLPHFLLLILIFWRLLYCLPPPLDISGWFLSDFFGISGKKIP